MTRLTTTFMFYGLALGIPLSVLMLNQLGRSEARDVQVAKDVSTLVDQLIALTRSGNPVARVTLLTIRSGLVAYVKQAA